MFSKIKNFLGFSQKSAENFNPIWNFSSLIDFWRKNEISKTELLNLFTGYSYVCIVAVAEWIAGIDRKLFIAEKREDKEKQHEYLDFITNSFLEEVTWFLEITGICYIRKKFFWKKLEWLEVLRSDLVTKRQNWSYDYYFNWKIINFPEEEIFEIKHFSPFKNGSWFSPLQALWKQQKMDDAILQWNWNFFKNGASSWTTLQTETNLTKEQKEYIVEKWKYEFMWVNNSHKVAILDNWLKQVKSEIWQKDMDFVNQRIQIRDEIFTIFRVPKVVVWITDWVGYTDRLVWKTNFAEFKLKPIALKIQEALNKNVFAGIWFFKFVNIVPVDVDELAKDFKMWVITIDEYRIKRNYLNIKNWNRNISWEVFEYENNWNYSETRDFSVEEILQKTIKNFVSKNEKNFENEDFCQKRWEQKITRTDKYEKDFKENLINIFELQEKEILKNIELKFSKKSEEDEEIDEDDLFSDIAFLIIFQRYFYNNYLNLMKTESNLASVEAWNQNLNFEKIKKHIWELIKKFALEINKTTKSEILEIIKSGVKDWIWYEEIKTNVKNKFSLYKKSRIEKIARTEVTRAINKTREETWRQNSHVKQKKWYAPLDERWCDFCAWLHWKSRKIWEIFEKNDYEDISWPPFHPNCRCDLVPILDYLEE